MKFLHIITNFSKVGGAEKMLARVLSADKEHSHVVISLMSTSKLMLSLVPSNVSFVSLNAKGVISLLLCTIKIIPYIKKSDKVYCWMYHANVLGTLAHLFSTKRIPLIWGVRHSLDDTKSESFSTKTALWLGKLLGSIPDKVIYCAERSLEQHVDFGYSPSTTALYIPNGYLFNDFIPKDFNSEVLIFGAAGRFHDAKDYETFFAVVGKLQKVHCNLHVEVAGRGIELTNPQIVNWLKKFDLDPKRITLLGELSDMDAFYRRIHFFALTSITEGFPNVLAEAASYGCICVSTDVGDASVIIGDPNRIVPVKGVEQMVAAFTDILKMDSQRLLELSMNSAKDIRARFDIKKISQQIMEVGN